MRIAVIGATGVLGRQVVPRLIERGHDVRPIVRTDDHLRRFERLGIRALRGDIFDARSLELAVRGCGATAHLATAVPLPGHAPDWALNDRIRREGTANLVTACRSAGVNRYVQQSVAHLVADGSATVVDEAAPLRPTTVTASAVDMEAIVAGSNLEWIVLRGGAFYGPGTGRDEQWRQLARTGELRLPNDGSDYVSLIHVTDMADAVVRAVDTQASRVTLAIVDDAPVTYGELFEYIARLEGAPEPQRGGAALWPSFRVSNAKAREVLRWRPRMPTYRSGLAASEPGPNAFHPGA